MFNNPAEAEPGRHPLLPLRYSHKAIEWQLHTGLPAVWLWAERAGLSQLDALQGTPVEKPELIRMLADVQEHLRSTLVGLWREEMKTSRVTTEWSIHDILSHLAGWRREHYAQIEALARGTSEDLGYAIDSSDNYREWNALAVAERRDQDTLEVLKELADWDVRLRTLVASLPDDELDRPGRLPYSHLAESTARQLVASHCYHEGTHIDTIAAWKRGGLRSAP